MLVPRAAPLVAKQNQVGAAAYAEFREQDSKRGISQCVRKCAAGPRLPYSQDFQAIRERTSCSRRLSSAGESARSRRPCVEVKIESTKRDSTLRGYPESARSDQRQRARQLLARFLVIQNALHALAQQRIAVGFFQVVAHDKQTRCGVVIQDIAQRAPVAWRAACASIT